MSNGNGYTNKELLNIIIETQEKTNERIDLLHEKVNSKISRPFLSHKKKYKTFTRQSRD